MNIDINNTDALSVIGSQIAPASDRQESTATKAKTERTLFRIGPVDPTVTEKWTKNKGETCLETGQVRLQWLVPIALSHLGRPYELWDEAKGKPVPQTRYIALRPIATELADFLNCGEDFIYELVKRLKNLPGGPLNATAYLMLKKHQGGGAGTSRFSPQQEKALTDATWAVCVDRGVKPGTRKANEEIRSLLRAGPEFVGCKVPTAATIRSRCRSDAIKVAREDAYVRDHLNRLVGDPEKITGLYSQLAIDCSTMSNESAEAEVRIVTKDGEDLGVANTIWGILGANRGVWTVLGFPGSPNAFLVGAAIRRGLLAKDGLLKDCGLTGASWPFHGLVGEIRHDNGSEFVNAHIEAALRSRNIGIPCIDRTPPRTPHERGKNERFHRTGQMLFYRFMGSEVAKRYLRTVKGKPGAIGITLDDLNRALIEWVVTEYHERPNNGLGGDSPMSRFEKFVEGKNGLPLSGLNAPLEDTLELRWDLMCCETRTVNHLGIQMHNRRYKCDALNGLLAVNSRSSERKLEVRFNPYKMGKVYVKIPNERGLEIITPVPYVPETERYRPSLEIQERSCDCSLWEWRAVWKMVCEGNTSRPTAGLAEAILQRQEQKGTARGAQKTKTGSRVRRALRGFCPDIVPIVATEATADDPTSSTCPDPNSASPQSAANDWRNTFLRTAEGHDAY